MVFLGIDWGKIFSIPFWLEVSPGELSPRFEKIFLAVLFISYLIYFLSKFFEKRLTARRNFIKAKFLQKTASFCLFMAVSFTFIFFFRYEAIPILGGRFWILIWLITGVIWLGYLLHYYFTKIPQQLTELEQKQKKDKYLVGIKKKKK
jgi:hypothetical protein